MKSWDEISDNAARWMTALGGFSPTTAVENREVKGYVGGEPDDPRSLRMWGKTYLDPTQLRELAAACTEVAAWLDERASAGRGERHDD